MPAEGLLQRVEQQRSGLRQSAADGHDVQVEQVGGRGQRDAQGQAGPAHRRQRHLVPSTGVLGQLAGGGLAGDPAVRAPPLLLGPSGQRRTAGDRLQAASAAADAGLAVRLDDDVADVPGVAVRAGDGPAVQDEPPADAGRDDHAEQVGDAPAGAPPVLADGQAHRVVVHPDGDPRELGTQPGTQREPLPGRDVQRGDLPFGPDHRSAAAHADATDPLRASLDEYRVEQRVDRPPQRLGVDVATGRGRCAAGVPHPSGPVDQGDRDLAAADVDGQHRAPVVGVGAVLTTRDRACTGGGHAPSNRTPAAGATGAPGCFPT